MYKEGRREGGSTAAAATGKIKQNKPANLCGLAWPACLPSNSFQVHDDDIVQHSNGIGIWKFHRMKLDFQFSN